MLSERQIEVIEEMLADDDEKPEPPSSRYIKVAETISLNEESGLTKQETPIIQQRKLSAQNDATVKEALDVLKEDTNKKSDGYITLSKTPPHCTPNTSINATTQDSENALVMRLAAASLLISPTLFKRKQ